MVKIGRIARYVGAALLATMAFATFPAHADKLREIIDRGYLIVGTTSTTPPFGFKDEKGELQGFDIEMSKLIAKALFGDPEKVKFELLSNEARWSAIENEQVDMVAQFTTITPTRLTRVGFTPKYFDTGFTLLVRKDASIGKIQDANRADIKVGTLTVPEQIDIMARIIPNAKVSSFESVDQQFLALRSGRVDAIGIDLPIGLWYAAQHDELAVIPEVFTGYQNYGIAYKLGELTWKQFLDGFVSELTTGYSYFEYEKIYRKFFKVAPPPQKPYTLKVSE